MMSDGVQPQRSALLSAHDQSLNVTPMRKEIIPISYPLLLEDVQPCELQSNVYEVKHQSLSLPEAVSSGSTSNVCSFNDDLWKLLSHSYMQSQTKNLKELQLHVNMRHLRSLHNGHQHACKFSFAALSFLRQYKASVEHEDSGDRVTTTTSSNVHTVCFWIFNIQMKTNLILCIRPPIIHQHLFFREIIPPYWENARQGY